MRPLLAKALGCAATLAAAAALSGALAPAGAAQQGCIAPDLLGVSLAKARHALAASGCALQLRQLPGHGHFVTPSSPDERQLVGAQRPPRGARAQSVTLWLKPLCSQTAAPGPETPGPTTEGGPTELVAGLFLKGGPLRLGPRCRHPSTAGGTLTVATTSGEIVASRTVTAGGFAVFPLKPGRYVVTGSTGASRPQPQHATVTAKHLTRLNLVAPLP